MSWRDGVVCVLLGLLTVGCHTGGPPMPWRVWGGVDGAIDGRPAYVLAMNSTLDLESFDVLTWPELEPVPYTVETGTNGEGDFALFSPESPAPRWYVVRWQARAGVQYPQIAGLPLNDGSYVWRFYGVSAPAVSRVFPLDGDVFVQFTENVRPSAGFGLSDITHITQDDLVCVPITGMSDLGPGHEYMLGCTPELDWTRDFRIQIDHAESANGTPIEPVDVTGRFASIEDAVLVPDRSVTPPPVPASLCAGSQCE